MVVVEGSSFASSTVLDAVVYDAVVYKGIDGKMHWGSGKVNLPADTPPDDPRTPKRGSSGDLEPPQASRDCALAQKACRDGYAALYTRAQSLFRDLAMARADGSLRSLLARLSRTDVLVIDDWAMAPLSEPERRDFWEICEDRYQVRSTILTPQLPVSRWHEQIGDPTLADGILDRLVHNAHRIEMRGDSMRKNRGKA